MDGGLSDHHHPDRLTPDGASVVVPRAGPSKGRERSAVGHCRAAAFDQVSRRCNLAAMAVGRRPSRAALGFAVHTGWAAMVAVSSGSTSSVEVLDRRRLEMIAGRDPEIPRFAYHAAKDLPLDAAERLIRGITQRSLASAKTALKAAVEELETRDYRVVASCLIVGGRPLPASLASILQSHALIHTAEGELFRGALRGASESLEIPVTEVRAKELRSRAAGALRISTGHMEQHLEEIGRVAGRPWAKDQKEACLAAAIALWLEARADHWKPKV